MKPGRGESVAMRPTRIRFSIRWLMETTAIIAIALWVTRCSPAAWLLILWLLVIYYYGLAPLRRLFGFAPLRRYFARWASGYVPNTPESRAKDEERARDG